MSVKLKKQGRIAYVVFDRMEKRNAFTMEMTQQLAGYWETIEHDPDIWVVILAAEGDHFTVGTDLNELAEILSNEPEVRARNNFWHEAKHNVIPSNLTKPVIAAVKGYCIGVGLSIVADCDIVVASDDAVFSFPEVKVGQPTVTGCWWLTRKIPMNIALEVVLLGEQLAAARANQYGLVNHVTAKEDVLPKAEELAEKFSRKNAPLAVRAVKEIAIRSMDMSFDDISRFGESLRTLLFHSDDSKEGPLAFVEKRDPEFRAK